MMKFEAQILSKEIIKPSSPEIHQKEPFKLCVFDQLTPTTYVPIILKKSLSETLNILYPFSGRIFSNLFIHDFDAGVPFLSTLNNLLPCTPLSKESNHRGPLLVCQVTMFACGGIALGICASHKITDANTTVILGFVWSTICQGYHPEIRFPALSKEAIAILKDMTKGEVVTTPTRTIAISAFIWKCSMAASRAIQGTLKPSIVVQVVKMRSKGKLTTLDGSIGNVFWLASALSNPAETGTELSTLVELMSQSIAAIDDEYMRSVQGEQGFEAIAEHLNQLELLFSFEKPDIFAFTSWINTHFDKLDFGWGQPCSWAILGKAGQFGNLTILVETKYGKGIEAWITLDETRMYALQKDHEFLNFASPDLQISSL
ncbi:hypothetical protein GOBAR_AA19735 [Gossypium barbadense]|uniref:Uncharacterized protein n=1 Tax=Gossypium barbadense TaxID=3634 RepID=A0A2P5XC45_GOSBA|nr:hypothetical protein GOBAR_AA19735 [Gossypium barbadense]